jgi:hypothetical protein
LLTILKVIDLPYIDLSNCNLKGKLKLRDIKEIHYSIFKYYYDDIEDNSFSKFMNKSSSADEHLKFNKKNNILIQVKNELQNSELKDILMECIKAYRPFKYINDIECVFIFIATNLSKEVENLSNESFICIKKDQKINNLTFPLETIILKNQSLYDLIGEENTNLLLLLKDKNKFIEILKKDKSNINKQTQELLYSLNGSNKKRKYELSEGKTKSFI